MKMSETSQALLGFLQQHGPLGVDALLRRHSPESRTELHKRLGNLQDNGWVQRTTAAGASRWSVHPAARLRVSQLLAAAASSASADAAASQPTRWQGAMVPPRRVDVMHGLTYQDATPAPARPGALDFKALPSRGFHG